MKLLYKGKAKDVYSTNNPNEVIVDFKNDVTAGNGAKKDTIEGKGKLNNLITEIIFLHLHRAGIQTHFIKRIDDKKQLVKKVEIIPLEVIVRNIAAGSFSRNYGVEEGTPFAKPTFELSYKKDELGDPLLTKDFALSLNIVNEEEYQYLRDEAMKINDILIELFESIDLTLVDFKLEFGKDENGNIILADEFSPDNSRLWDANKKRFDKDNYRKDIGSLTDAYTEVLSRLQSMEKPLQEECGVFGIFNVDKAPWLTFNGLHALQHRGQDSAGISWISNNKIMLKKGNGLIDHVFGDTDLGNIESNSAIGHVRYSTTGDLSTSNIHPFRFRHTKRNFALAHNGNISNSYDLKVELEEQGSVFFGESDSEMIGHMLLHEEGSFDEALMKALPKIEGAFSLVIITEDCIYAARDRIGFRPLSFGKLDNGYVVSSEPVAYDVIDGEMIRDIKPGEIIKISKDGIESMIFADQAREKVQLDAMELIYFSRPDSVLDGVNVHEFRKESGRVLAKEFSPEVDIVCPVPESSISAALGYAEVSGIPFELGLVKNKYVARTFIESQQTHREIGVKRKLNASTVVKGKKVLLIDDSIVRGTTMKRIIKMVRDQGAKEVHILIASPMVIAPSYYGINISTYHELLANRCDRDVEKMRQELGADSLGFLSIEGTRSCAPSLDLEMCIFEDKYQTKISEQLIAEARNEK